jgi:hypothetical protein
MRNVLLLLGYLSIFPIGMIGLFSVSLWLSDHTHEFGPKNFRYWLLIYGTDAARLDLIEPIQGSVRYAARGKDGNAPAYVFTEFKTQLPPKHIIDAYEARCSAIGLATRRTEQEGAKPILHCDSQESEFGITATTGADATKVTIKGWMS